MSAYRRDPARAFTEAERVAMELIVPHVVSAAREAQLGQLRAATHVADTQGQSAAVVSDLGVVLEAEPGFVELLRVEWPIWTGPRPAKWSSIAWCPPADTRFPYLHDGAGSGHAVLDESHGSVAMQPATFSNLLLVRQSRFAPV